MDILREFLETSTIHGLSYISTTKVLRSCLLCEFKTKTQKIQSQAQIDRIEDYLQTKHDLILDKDYFFFYGNGGEHNKGFFGTK